MISESRAEEEGISCVKAAPLGPVLWALVDFQLTPLTRNNLPVAVDPHLLNSGVLYHHSSASSRSEYRMEYSVLTLRIENGLRMSEELLVRLIK